MPLTRTARRRRVSGPAVKSPWKTKGNTPNPLKQGVSVKKVSEAWVVVNVSVDGVEGEENLVNCAVVCRTQKEAMETAFEKAYGIYQEYLEELKARNAPPVTFNEVWEEVDRYDGIEREYGFDPIYNKVAYCSIRVVKAVVA